MEKAKFQLQDLLPIGITLVVLGIGLSFGLQVISDVGSDMTTNSIEYNATQDTMTAVAKLPAKLPIIVTVIVAAVLIGILVRYLMVK